LGGYAYLPSALIDYLRDNNPGVKFVNFTDELDDIRLVKSAWEIERFQRCVDLHDRLMLACQSMIRPYLTAHELGLSIMDIAARLGATEFNTLLMTHWRDDQVLSHNAQIMPGDYIWVLIEVAGVGGEWGEVARTFRVGMEPEKIWVERSNNILAIQDAVAKACKPGAIPEDMLKLTNKMLKEFGYPEEKRFCMHGQTYDIVDLPFFIMGDKKPLKENMFFTIHPTYYTGTALNFIETMRFNYTDNYLVKKDGAQLLSHTPRKFITIPI